MLMLAVMLGPVMALAQLNFRTLPEFPAFKLKGSDGQVFTTTAVMQKNKPTVVIYFSPTCHHCQTQVQDITSNMKTFKDARFLLVTSYGEQDTRPFLDEYAIEKFPNIRFGYDTSYAMRRFFLLESMPGIFIYDKQGKFKRDFDTNVRPQTLYAAIFDKE